MGLRVQYKNNRFLVSEQASQGNIELPNKTVQRILNGTQFEIMEIKNTIKKQLNNNQK